MKNIVFVILIAVAIFGCKKFNHEEYIVPSCELCSFADSLTGTYRGLASGVSVPYAIPISPSADLDSLTITVNHIFLGNSKYDDSTVMHFATVFKYDSENAIYDTIEITRPDGFVDNNEYEIHEPQPGPSTGFYYIVPDSIRLTWNGPTSTGQSAPYIVAILQRQ